MSVLKPSKGSLDEQRYVGLGGEKMDLGHCTVKVRTEHIAVTIFRVGRHPEGVKVRNSLLAVSGQHGGSVMAVGPSFYQMNVLAR